MTTVEVCRQQDALQVAYQARAFLTTCIDALLHDLEAEAAEFAHECKELVVDLARQTGPKPRRTCVRDAPMNAEDERAERLTPAIRALQEEGWSVEQIAKTFRLTRNRTYSRALKKTPRR